MAKFTYFLQEISQGIIRGILTQVREFDQICSHKHSKRLHQDDRKRTISSITAVAFICSFYFLILNPDSPITVLSGCVNITFADEAKNTTSRFFACGIIFKVYFVLFTVLYVLCRCLQKQF